MRNIIIGILLLLSFFMAAICIGLVFTSDPNQVTPCHSPSDC